MDVADVGGLNQAHVVNPGTIEDIIEYCTYFQNWSDMESMQERSKRKAQLLANSSSGQIDCLKIIQEVNTSGGQVSRYQNIS